MAGQTEVMEVQEKHRFDVDKVRQYLAGQLPELQGDLEIRQFSTGQSNPTYLLQTPTHRYVMRRKPPGKLLPSAHAVDREFRVISAVHSQGYPVPRPILLCEDESIAGTTFYLMEYTEGRVFADRNLEVLPLEEREPALQSFIETMAKLHAMDYAQLGLEDFGRPGNYFARQISRWSKQYTASQTRDIAAMDRLMEWLPQNIPEDDSSSIVHGDYSLHNVMYHPVEPRLIAVLDWELSTIGHQLGDVFYSLMPWYSPLERYATLSRAEMQQRGMLDFDQMLERYCELSGRQAVPDVAFYKAYTLFRLAGIMQGIVGRVRDGTASNPNAALVAEQVAPLAEAGWNEIDN